MVNQKLQVELNVQHLNLERVQHQHLFHKENENNLQVQVFQNCLLKYLQLHGFLHCVNEQIQWLMLDEIDETEKKLEKCKKVIANHKKM